MKKCVQSGYGHACGPHFVGKAVGIYHDTIQRLGFMRDGSRGLWPSIIMYGSLLPFGVHMALYVS
jgi:hypothetical protein